MCILTLNCKLLPSYKMFNKENFIRPAKYDFKFIENLYSISTVTNILHILWTVTFNTATSTKSNVPFFISHTEIYWRAVKGSKCTH